MMESVPGADRGPRAGSPRGVVDATGSQPTRRSRSPNFNPVATAPGTDLITNLLDREKQSVNEIFQVFLHHISISSDSQCCTLCIGPGHKTSAGCKTLGRIKTR